jgi:hypothetical protein
MDKNGPGTSALLPWTASVALPVEEQIVLSGRAKLDLMIDVSNVYGGQEATCRDQPTKPNFGKFTAAGPPFQPQLTA